MDAQRVERLIQQLIALAPNVDLDIIEQVVRSELKENPLLRYCEFLKLSPFKKIPENQFEVTQAKNIFNKHSELR